MLVAIVCLVIFALVMTGLWLTERARIKISGQPTPKSALIQAQKTAMEIEHAPNDDIAARIIELRARGREGK